MLLQFFPQYLEFLLRLLYRGMNPAGLSLRYWSNVRIILYCQVASLRGRVYITNEPFFGCYNPILISFYSFFVGLNSQYLFKSEGDNKVIQQLVCLYNQGAQAILFASGFLLWLLYINNGHLLLSLCYRFCCISTRRYKPC